MHMQLTMCVDKLNVNDTSTSLILSDLLSIDAPVLSKKMSVSEALFRCIKERKVDRGVSHSGIIMQL